MSAGSGMERPDLLVVGAGVVGLSCAIALRERGLSVTVIDREGPAAGASAGNAGAFAFSDILPLASPKTLALAPRWLFDPLGPLSVPPAYALKAAPWMLRFAKASLPGQVRRSTIAQAALMALSRAELEPFLERTGILPMLRREGNLEVYESAVEFEASRPGWEARARAGIAFRHMDADEMAVLQPGLSPRFTHGTFTPDWCSIAEPRGYVLALGEHFARQGGRIEIVEARSLQPETDGVRIETSGETLRAHRVLVAAGAFSHRLTRTLGDRIPLETERGYNTTLPPGAFDLRTQVTFGGHGFVVTRLSSGVRVGGAVEFAGLDRPPNVSRADAMLEKAARFLPGLKITGGRRWMGFRPSLPDSLPAIGLARGTERVAYAFGHGHLGLTQSAGTARLVADLLTGRPAALDLSPFSPQRF